MYSDTCINRSCSKAGTLLRRTDIFELVCFLYASLSCISKVETVKWHCFRETTFFSPQIKKQPALRRRKKKLGIPRNTELNWTFLSIFSKRNIFLHFKTNIIFSNFILQFWKSTILFSRILYLIFQVALSKQQSFCVTERDIRQEPLNHTPPLYVLLVSVLWLILSFDEVSKTCRRMH